MTDERTRNRGFTLIEVLVVTVMTGLIAAVVAAAFATVIRTSPASESRNDDSRTLLGLTNFLPLDVSSAQAGSGIAIPGSDMSCGANPGTPLVQFSWTDFATGVTTQVGYRYVDDTGWRIVRYQCIGSAETVVRLTSKLPDPSTSPIVVTEIVGDHDKNPATTPNTVRMGIRFLVTTLSGGAQQIEALSDNAEETLAPVAVTSSTSTTLVPPSNDAPIAGDKSFDAWNDTPVVFWLPASDPNGDALTAAIGSPGLPSGWSASFTDLEMTLTPDPTAGVGLYTIGYRVTDAPGASATATINVNIVDTSVSTTTSTTSTTTTTTTTVPCSVTAASADPTSVSNGVHDNVAKLKRNVDVTIVKSGCTNLVLSFVPDTTTGVVREISFNDGTMVEINKADFDWSDGSHPLEVRAGAGGAVLRTTSLTVT